MQNARNMVSDMAALSGSMRMAGPDKGRIGIGILRSFERIVRNSLGRMFDR